MATSRRSFHDMMEVIVPEGVDGDWRIERFGVDEADAKCERLRAAIGHGGSNIWSGNYIRLMRGRTVVMSNTPDEKRDHIAVLVEAQRAGKDFTAIVGGLGLGMVLTALMEIGAGHVTVIEKSPAVIRLAGPTLESRFPGRLTIIEADVYDWRPPKGQRWNMAWWDIWDTKCEDNLDEMATLHRRFARRVDWQGSWGKEELRYWRRRNASAGQYIVRWREPHTQPVRADSFAVGAVRWSAWATASKHTRLLDAIAAAKRIYLIGVPQAAVFHRGRRIGATGVDGVFRRQRARR